MSAGQRIVEARNTARVLLPYLNHLDTCTSRWNLKCSCRLIEVIAQAKKLANADPARTRPKS